MQGGRRQRALTNLHEYKDSLNTRRPNMQVSENRAPKDLQVYQEHRARDLRLCAGRSARGSQLISMLEENNLAKVGNIYQGYNAW